MEKTNTPQPRAKRAAPSSELSQRGGWSVQQYKLSFELVFRRPSVRQGTPATLQMIADRLNELVALRPRPCL